LDRAASLTAGLREAENFRSEATAALESQAVDLFVRAPAIVNILLNYKICVEHGLPLHPTVYYELTEARKYKVEHPLELLEGANRLYRAAVELARSAFRLDAGWEGAECAFRRQLPPEILDFVYTSGPDRYTWRASEPAKLRLLAERIGSAFSPDLLVAAAHGSIMPGLLLAEYLQIPLYFVRFSMFKRRDEEPILSLADEVWLSGYREGRVILYDEDVAKGTTLERFSARLAPLFAETRTACSIRHAGAGIRPDFAARTWWD
ncbi:MAG TPA: hypothetical protein VMC79_03120, partial [Rectinemataceae bacterium]|nr:hypothetical protein [Rectinemataceae bacterium]